MLKQSKHNEIEILSVDDYIELFGKPNDTFGEQDQELLYKLIKQATTQFDSLISPAGEVGGLYRWWNNLKDNDDDNDKGFRLQKAIGSWVETMVQNGKFWTDGVPNMSSNIDYALNAKASNSNIELKRKDIIQDLTAIGLTITSNVGINKKEGISKENYDEWVLLSKSWVIDNFLPLDSQEYRKTIKAPVDFGDNDIQNCGDIYQSSSTNKSKLTNYRLIGCDVLIDDNNNIETTKSLNSDYILDPKDGSYKLIDQFPISYWNGLTEEQINYRIWASGSVYNPDFTYRKSFIVIFPLLESKRNKKSVKYKFALSKQDNNIGNDPNSSPDYWEILPIEPTELQIILDWCKNYIDNEILPLLKNETIPQEIQKQLNALPTIDYKSEAQGEIIAFNDLEDYMNYINQYGIDDSYFEDYEAPFKGTLIDLEFDKVKFIGYNGGGISRVIFEIDRNYNMVFNATLDDESAIKNKILTYNIRSDVEVKTGNYLNKKHIYVFCFQTDNKVTQTQITQLLRGVENVIDIVGFKQMSNANILKMDNSEFVMKGYFGGIDISFVQKQDCYGYRIIVYYTKRGE